MVAVLEFLKREGIRVEQNPDFYMRRYGQFSISDARELIERASLRAIGERRIFVLAVDSINAEAQHALLKTLEEPPGGALFFLIHPAPDTLLSTLRSRAQIVSTGRQSSKSTIDVEAFVKATLAKRLDMLKPLLEKGDDERRDVGEILAFLSNLEKRLEKSPDSLRALYRTRRYIGDRGALVKPLLEQVALLM